MPASLRALLTDLVDYAGLFPPAALPMGEVLANYHHYGQSAHAWMLGRLVVPAARLDECLAARKAQPGAHQLTQWRVSALIADVAEDGPLIGKWNAAHGHQLLVDACEIKADTPEEVARIARVAAANSATFIEIPTTDDPTPLIAAIARFKLKAKIRTGGVTPGAFPSAHEIARFLAACAEHGVALKATAGLHHPMRGSYRLTYAPAAPMGTMFGFLNVFVASIAAQNGVAAEELVPILEERDPACITFDEHTLMWGERAIDVPAIEDARSRFALSFGSCSFREPVEDLQHLHFL